MHRTHSLHLLEEIFVVLVWNGSFPREALVGKKLDPAIT
jgi:hypothetical protein